MALASLAGSPSMQTTNACHHQSYSIPDIAAADQHVRYIGFLFPVLGTCPDTGSERSVHILRASQTPVPN